jgi:predicted nucleic acid-binding Zn ribbon protein
MHKRNKYCCRCCKTTVQVVTNEVDDTVQCSSCGAESKLKFLAPVAINDRLRPIPLDDY